RRAAWHADRIARAATPAERLAAAAAYLVSEAAHASSARAARTTTAEVAAHARRVMEQAAMSPASRALHESKLRAPGTEAARLSTALMVLRSALGRLPEAERDRMRGHYADELAREAAQLGVR
ncbi:hypothetical protein DZF91_24145, partial [Actinomadura logoneensis]